jgi:FdhD protein
LSDGKIFDTTGRLTSEVVIKTVQMHISILISRSGFTAWGVQLARRANLTLDRPGQGQRLHCARASSASRLTLTSITCPPERGTCAPAEARHLQRKSSLEENVP